MAKFDGAKIMKRLRFLGLATVSALFFAMSAIAPISSAQANDWSGAHIGVLVGWGSIDNDYTHSDGTPPPFAIETDGVLGGIFGGFDWQNGNAVFGIQGDFSVANMDGDWSANPDHVADIDWIGTFRARGGFLVHPNALIYVTGGLAVTRVNFKHIGRHTWNDTFYGWVIGGGFERILFDNVRGAIEGLYLDFDEETGPGHLHAGGATHSMSNDPSGFLIRAKLSIALDSLLQ